MHIQVQTRFHIRGGLESKRQYIFINALSPRYQNLEHHGMLHDPLEMKQSWEFKGNQTIPWILPSRALNNWSLKEFYPNYQADSFLMWALCTNPSGIRNNVAHILHTSMEENKHKISWLLKNHRFTYSPSLETYNLSLQLFSPGEKSWSNQLGIHQKQVHICESTTCWNSNTVHQNHSCM
jgi:hypothetical protein